VAHSRQMKYNIVQADTRHITANINSAQVKLRHISESPRKQQEVGPQEEATHPSIAEEDFMRYEDLHVPEWEQHEEAPPYLYQASLLPENAVTE